MSGQEITFDEVATAADGLVDHGLPVTVSHLRASLPTAAVGALHQHLLAWRAAKAKPAAELPLDVPDAVTAALKTWAQQLAQDATSPLRDALSHTEGDLASLLELNAQAEAARDDQTARLAERDATIARLTIELRQARDVASNALVGKAKDQLAIDGKDAQIADLRREIERLLALSAAASDAKLAAEMDLVGAVTARDNYAAEVNELRAQLDAR
jgi:hypothetical protein